MLEDKIIQYNPKDVHFYPVDTGTKIKDPNKTFWEIGYHYRLKSETYDGFTITHPEYECKGIITEHAGIPINSVVMKNVSAIDSMEYTLSKNDCASFNIHYEPQLTIFPQSLPWEKLPRFPICTFDQNDFSTFPVSQTDGKIHSCAIVVENITPLASHHNMVYLEQLDCVADIANYSNIFTIVSKVTIQTNHVNICFENQPVPNTIVTIEHWPRHIIFTLKFLDGIERDEFKHMACSDMFSINVNTSYLTPIKEYCRRVESYKKIRNTAKMWDSLTLRLSDAPVLNLESHHIPIIY